MADDHPFLDDIPAYALGALDTENVAALEAHLQTCETCRTELAAYRAVSDKLLVALPPRTPSAALRRRLQGRLPGAQKAPRPRWAWSVSQTVLTLVVVLLLVLNVFSFTQIQALQRQQAQLNRQVETGQTALAMLAYSGTQTLPISANSVTGNLLLDKDRNTAVLILWNLPSLNENQTYQVWLIDSQGKHTNAGLFRPQADLPFTTVPVLTWSSLSDFTGLSVTVEMSGGSDYPTGMRLFMVNF
jgi:anti-sigma-K factor RskA